MRSVSTEGPSVGDMSWWRYVRKHSNGETNTTIGRKVGISGSSVGRWDKSRPDPAQAAAFARAYNRPVLEAFIAAGFLTPEEASERPSAPPSLTSLTDDDLLKEVAKRMREGGSSANTGEPQEKTPDPGGVYELRAAHTEKNARKDYDSED